MMFVLDVDKLLIGHLHVHVMQATSLMNFKSKTAFSPNVSLKKTWKDFV